MQLTARRQHGFTYLGLVIMVAIIGLVAVCALQVGAITQRRQAEQELLETGRQFLDALNAYAEATPNGTSRHPARMEDLLIDPRFPGIRRYLRRVYVDPLTGNTDWGLVVGSGADGSGIVGVYSLSTAVPIKQANFDSPFEYFKGAKSYRDWIFTTQPPELLADPAAAPATVDPNQPATPPRQPKPPKPGHS
jgi:type II secretory pathway pseudopilin PulG